MSWLSAIPKLANNVLGFFFDTPEIKQEKARGKLELQKLELELKKESMRAAAKAEADYDLEAMRNMKTSWKDEYLMILHTFPIWGYAIPNEDVHKSLDRVWFQLGNADYWWWLAYFGILASTFGLRWLFSDRVDKMMERKNRNGMVK